MIFRRSNETAQTKNPMNGNRRTAGMDNTLSRREPEVAMRPGMTMTNQNQTGQAQTSQAQTSEAMTQSSQTTGSATMTASSPAAMAQARRPQNTAHNFTRPEQLRKLTVGRDISLNGEITTCDHLIVEGTVTATIKGGQILEISESGSFSGLVDIEQADIAGNFDGDLTVRGKVILRPTANVSGKLTYGTLQIDAGAILDGQVTALKSETAAQTPITSETPSYTKKEKASATPSQSEQDSHSAGLALLNDQPGFLKASSF